MGEALSTMGLSLLLLALALSLYQIQQPQYATKLEAALNEDTSGDLVQIEEKRIGVLEDEESNSISISVVIVKQKRPVKGLAVSINDARVYVDLREIRGVINALEKMSEHVGSEAPDKIIFATKAGFRLELSTNADGSTASASIDETNRFLLNDVEQLNQLRTTIETANDYLQSH